MSNPMIQVRGLAKSFGSLKVWENIDLDIAEGEKIAIIGGSGCGKSVFLRSLELLLKPDKGQILIDGENITARGADLDQIRRKMGMVYQNFCLFEHMNVMDNLCLAPTYLLKMPRKQAEEKALGLLREVGLASRGDAWPSKLSGGQKQRIAIARCLMMDPRIMLFDEPTSALDPTMVGEVLATIRSLSKKKLTMIVVTHEMSFARSFADRILFFADHGIYEQGTPEEIFENPQKELTRQFIRKVKCFDYHIEDRNYDLMAMAGGIHSFGERYGIKDKMVFRLQLCAEELVEEILSHVGSHADLNLAAEYSEVDQMVQMHCDWAGDAFNPLQDGDELRMMVLNHSAKEINHEFRSGRNELMMKL